MKFSLIPVVLAFALVACKSPVKLDSASVEDRQAASAAAEKSPTPILGNSLLKDAANSARNVAALDLSSKDANARAVGAAGLSGSAVADAAGKSAVATAAGASGAAGSSSAASAALAMRERIVYFDFDSFIIRPEARPIIEAHGRRLRADAKLHVALEGHTDDRGGREYNLGLGQKRADAVRKALSLMGVADSQMEAVSFGKEKPAVPGNTEAAMQENRRVEISYR